MGTAADNALNNALMRLMAQDPLPPMPQEAMPRSMVLAPPGGVMDLPTIPDDPRIKAIQDAQAQAKQDFANIRSGNAGPAPTMSAVTGNRTLLANDERSSQLGQLKDTLAGMNPRPSAPEPVMPSRAAQTGAYGSSAYQSDRNARLAILNEQERNRQPIPALPEHTINLDNLPDALKQVYAQRAANDTKRAAMVNPLDGNTIRPVAKTAGEKAARASEYEAAGLAVPAVFAPIASPEKVRADKQRRAEEEAYRQGNWSMQEQAKALSRKLGINPLLATAMVSDRMQQGAPVTGDGEPRMPASWEPRLREGANDGLSGDIMQAALLGPQGAAAVRVANAQQAGATDRARIESDTRTGLGRMQGENALAQINARGAAELPLLMERGKQMLMDAQARGANALQLAELQGRIRQQLEKMGLDAKNQQIAMQGLQQQDAIKLQGQQAQDLARLQSTLGDNSADLAAKRELSLNPKLPLDVQLEGQQIAAERERLSAMGVQAPPEQLRRLQQREQALQQRISGKPATQQQWPSSLDIAPDINKQLENLIMGDNSPEMVEWGPDNWDIWHPQRVKPNLERAAALLAEQNGMPLEQARNYAGEWLQKRRDSSWLPFYTTPSRQNVGF